LYFRKKVEFEKLVSLLAELLGDEPAFELASFDANAGSILNEDPGFTILVSSWVEIFEKALYVIKYMNNIATNHIPFPAIFNVSTIFFAGLSSSLWRKI
jgi:hypothetical protein